MAYYSSYINRNKIFRALLVVFIAFLFLVNIPSISYGSYSLEYMGVSFTISDNFIANNPYYVIFVSDTPISSQYYSRVVRSNSPLTINKNINNNTWRIYNNNNDGITSSMLTLNDLRNFFNNDRFSSIPSTGNYFDMNLLNTTWSCLFTNSNILDYSTNAVVYPSSIIKYPEITNSLSDLESLNFDVISINAWDYSNQNLYALFYDRNVLTSSSTEGIYPKRVIELNQDTTYYQAALTADPNQNAIYWIPIDETGLNFYVGGTYVIKLAERVTLDPPVAGVDYSYNYLGQSVTFTISSDVSQNKIAAINKEIEDTTNKKYHDETISEMNSINNNINNVNNALTNTIPDNSISSDIDNSLDFNNQNEGLNNLNGGFFSRLTTMLSNLLGYDLSVDTSVSIPLPNTNKALTLHSKDIYDNVTGALRLIINAFWIYIFSFYMWKFINKIYIALSTGNILDTFSSSGEAITNDML